VDEIITYTEYWHDPRFQIKKPNFRSSIRNAFGDNIYHKDAKTVKWVQENSHHSNPDGTPNPLNIEHDTASPRVLIGREFVYWGGQQVEIPARFKKVCAGRGHKSRFSPDFIESFIAWVESLGQTGYQADPF